jgi:hypothetical protein
MKNLIESQAFSLGTGSWDKDPNTDTAQKEPKLFTEPETDPDDSPREYDVRASTNNYGGTTAYQVTPKNTSERSGEE